MFLDAARTGGITPTEGNARRGRAVVKFLYSRKDRKARSGEWREVRAKRPGRAIALGSKCSHDNARHPGRFGGRGGPCQEFALAYGAGAGAGAGSAGAGAGSAGAAGGSAGAGAAAGASAGAGAGAGAF